MAADRENFIFFLCPLDGVRFNSSAAFQSLKPVYDGLQKIKFEKSRAKYKAEHAD